MATQRWNDERLDRLAESVEANTRDIAANTRDIAANTRDIAANTRDIAALRESIAETNRTVFATNQNMEQLIIAIRNQHEASVRTQEANNRVFQMLIEEIRGLRAENRRILAHLFGEQQSE